MCFLFVKGYTPSPWIAFCFLIPCVLPVSLIVLIQDVGCSCRWTELVMQKVQPMGEQTVTVDLDWTFGARTTEKPICPASPTVTIQWQNLCSEAGKFGGLKLFWLWTGLLFLSWFFYIPMSSWKLQQSSLGLAAHGHHHGRMVTTLCSWTQSLLARCLLCPVPNLSFFSSFEPLSSTLSLTLVSSRFLCNDHLEEKFPRLFFYRLQLPPR